MLTTKHGILRTASEIARILKKNRICKRDFDIPWGNITAQQAIILNKVEEELPSASDVAKVDHSLPQSFPLHLMFPGA